MSMDEGNQLTINADCSSCWEVEMPGMISNPTDEMFEMRGKRAR
jgi:hypothetical protein